MGNFQYLHVVLLKIHVLHESTEIIDEKKILESSHIPTVPIRGICNECYRKLSKIKILKITIGVLSCSVSIY